MEVKTKAGGVRGKVRLWELNQQGMVAAMLAIKNNQIQIEWANILTKLLSGFSAYRISGMYVEFENVGDPLDEVTVPDYLDTEGSEYYEDLQLDATRDFLRVPLQQMPLLTPSSGYSDYFTEDGTGNVATFYAQTQGTVGIHGKGFTNGDNSKVYGLALISTPDWGDRTQDLVFARLYFSADEQTVKPASSQLAVSWDIKFMVDSLGDT